MFKYVTAGLLFSLLTVSGISYWVYQKNQETIATLQQREAVLEIDSQTKQIALDEAKRFQIRQNNINSSVNNQLAASRQENKILEQKLAEHDLAYLALNRPGLVENVINNATDKASRCLEILSGAPLTTAEREAQNAQQFNSECPSLFATTR